MTPIAEDGIFRCILTSAHELRTAQTGTIACQFAPVHAANLKGFKRASENSLHLISVWKSVPDHVIKPAKEGVIEELRVVRCGNENTFGFVQFDELEEAVENAAN